jgi:hypothetical protein
MCTGVPTVGMLKWFQWVRKAAESTKLWGGRNKFQPGKYSRKGRKPYIRGANNHWPTCQMRVEFRIGLASVFFPLSMTISIYWASCFLTSEYS